MGFGAGLGENPECGGKLIARVRYDREAQLVDVAAGHRTIRCLWTDGDEAHAPPGPQCRHQILFVRPQCHIAVGGTTPRGRRR